jgi:hypothetical protein
MIDRKTLEHELTEMKLSYKSIVNSNTKLMDEKNWAIEDKKRAERKISLALDLIKNYKGFKDVEQKEFRDNLIRALEEDYFE